MVTRYVKILQKIVAATLSRGKGAGGWGGHGHLQVRLNTSLGYFNFILDIP